MSWEKVTIKSISKQIRGVSYTPKDVSDTPIDNYLRLLRANNITENGIDLTDTVYVNRKCISETQKLKVGDILIVASSGSIKIVGKAILIENQINSTFGAFCKVIRPNEKVDHRYLSYYFRSSDYRRKISHLAAGANINNLRNEDLDNLLIPLPPLATQKRIAKILDAADALKRKDQQLLKKYDELAQAIFIDMFGDPVKNEKGWEVKKLKDISSKIHSGNTPKGGSNVYVKNGITFFRSQNVWKNNLVYNDIAFIDDKIHKSMIKSSLKYKDILMTKTGRINTENSSLGRAALFVGEDDSANVNGHVYLIRLLKDQVHEFVLQILTSKQYRDLIREVCVGGIDKRQLNKDHIEEFPIIYPPLKSQIKYSELLGLLNSQKKGSEKVALNSEKIFNSLIQKAFNGELVN